MVSTEPTTAYKIVAISGSLRKDSFNTAWLRHIASVAPKDRIASVEIINYKGMPVYDGDLEAESGIPECIKEASKKIAEADAIYFSTPEYNLSVSSALKTFIDWVSRVDPQPMANKPCAIASVTAGPSGGLRAQYELRKVMLFMRVHMMGFPEMTVPNAYQQFDKEGNVTEDKTKQHGLVHINAFADHIDWVKRAERKD